MFKSISKLKTGRRLKVVHEHTRARSQQRMTTGEIKKSEAHWLATSTNLPPERSRVCEPVQKHALGVFPVLMDLLGPVLGESRLPSSLSASMLSVCVG